MDSELAYKRLKNWIIIGISFLIAGISSCSLVSPIYHVWEQEKKGTAELRRAEQNRKILVEQARAEKDAAVLRAEAISIVGAAAQKYPEYRLQEFLGAFGEALQSENIEKIIFVPTEANIPITEAGRTAK